MSSTYCNKSKTMTLLDAISLVLQMSRESARAMHDSTHASTLTANHDRVHRQMTDPSVNLHSNMSHAILHNTEMANVTEQITQLLPNESHSLIQTRQSLQHFSHSSSTLHTVSLLMSPRTKSHTCNVKRTPPTSPSVSQPLKLEQIVCSVCLLRDIDIVLIPCGHITICKVCFSHTEFNVGCPICRSNVSDTIRFFVAGAENI
ncbi:hypothetical protein MT418_006895 [Batrachochytrium dendrobatidis]